MKLFKRGNRWWVSEMKDGKQCRRSLGPDVKTREEAEQYLIATAQAQNELTLRSFIKSYLEESRIRLSKQTIRCYKCSLIVFESYFGIDRQIDSITAREISLWAASRLNEGLSPESVNADLRAVKAAFNRALRWELIEKVPRIEMVKTPKRLPRHLSMEQFQEILNQEPDMDFKRIFVFMVWTGARRGEALGLRWEHVSLCDKPQALITGKGDKQRVIPLLPPAVEALGEIKESGFVFRQANEDYISHRFLFAARRAGIKAKLHDLRHTALTWMVGRGAPVKLVQEIAGHTDIKTTMNYAKSFSGGAYDTLFKAFNFI